MSSLNQIVHVPLEKISIERARHDWGDIEDLMLRIERHGGLLQPVGLKKVEGKNEESEYGVIFGRRRYEAYTRLAKHDPKQWGKIPARIFEGVDFLLAEADENIRKNLTPSEAIELGRTMEETEKEEAYNRRVLAGMRRAGKNPKEKVSERVESREWVDRIGEAVGMSGSYYRRAKKVMEAAEADPDKFGDLPKLMDDKSISHAYKLLLKRLPSNAFGHASGSEHTEVLPSGRGSSRETKPLTLEDIREQIIEHLAEITVLLPQADLRTQDEVWELVQEFKPRDLAQPIQECASQMPTNGPGSGDFTTLDRDREIAEKTSIERALRNSGYSRAKAANSLGISRVTLYKKMKKYGLIAVPPHPTFSWKGD